MSDCVGRDFDENCPYNGQRTHKYTSYAGPEGLKWSDRNSADYLCDRCKEDIMASYPKFKCRTASCNNPATITHLEDHMSSLGLDEEEFCDDCKSDFLGRQVDAYYAGTQDLSPEVVWGSDYNHLQNIDEEPQPLEKAWRFLKAQMSDVHLGFQEDPEREIARLMHMGVSRAEATRMYQQYLDSLGSGA